MRVLGLLADRGRRLEADEEEDAEQDAAEHATAGDPEQRGLARVEHRQGVPVLAALGDDHEREDQHRHERDHGERQHRADREAHAEVVEDEDDRERDHAPDPPGGTAVGDVRLPEAVDEDPEPEIDAAAAEEERADEEEAGREDADPRVRSVREVLVHRPRAGVLPGVERDRVRDREHADAGDQHGERRVPAGADVGARDAAEDEGDREHGPDRERLRDRVDGGEVLLSELAGRARSSDVGLAHLSPPPVSSPSARNHLRPPRGHVITFEHRMSTIRPPRSEDTPQARTLRVRSVVGLAYDEIRSLIVAGSLAPGSRLAQGELADRLGISRGSVREALRRLAGDGLVDFEVNRGFFVAEVGLDDVRQRLEARLALEPEIARLAAAALHRRRISRRCGRRSRPRRRRARSDEVHDASRAFHVAVAEATQNQAFTKLLDALWIADVGRRLLAQRSRRRDWQDRDVEEHRAILAGARGRRRRRAARLMSAHVESAVRHWSPRA